MPRSALITGASAGAGRAMAHRFAAEGFDIVAVARRGAELEALQAEIEAAHPVTVQAYAVDLGDLDQAVALYQAVRDRDIDLMINNAGLGDWNFVWDVGLERLLDMIDLNARALAVLSTLFVRDRRDTDATLINVTSLAGYSLFGGAVPYSATKFFATTFTEGLILDLAAVGSPMRVKVMAPGPIDTEFTAISLAESKLQGLDASGVRFHGPEQIAEFAWQLFESDAAVGMVDLASMEFVLRERVHPSASLGG